LTDALSFLTAGSWTTPVFWLLLIGSAAAAVLAWRADPTQHAVRHVVICLLRIVVGTMWWQQSLWKIPPHYDWARLRNESQNGSVPSRIRMP